MTSQITWTTIAPSCFRSPQARTLVLRCIRAVVQGDGSVLERVRTAFLSEVEDLPAGVALETRVLVCILCDLAGQKWHLRVNAAQVQIAPPEQLESAEARRAQLRSQLLVERDAQLRDPAVRRFVREMERRRLVGGRWHSVYSLMRDGRELGAVIDACASIESIGERAGALEKVIRPYVQMAEPEETCAHTGFRLMDIWRYFRYTWTTPQQSTPGRKMCFLVRDSAAPFHPVIGIGALGSSIVQLQCRDQWIGWQAETFLGRLRKCPTAGDARWLHGALQELLRDIYIADFIKAGIFKRRDLKRPNPKLIKRLADISRRERAQHHLYPDRQKHKEGASTTAWLHLAQTPLFRAKRALALAELLQARLALQEAGFTTPSKAALQRALADRGASAGIAAVLRRVKASHAGVNMMDITICGAIAPYNTLLGGKLVGLLSAGPDVVRAYERRYRTTASIIASSLGGRAIVRPPRLVLLGTTSLYDRAPSQYNRLRMPAEVAGGVPGLQLGFEELGKTAGYGSFHFSQITMKAFEQLLARNQKGRQVNSIFGEGVNPKLRKVRSALDAVGMPSDLLLRHGGRRVVYGIPLAANFREVLLNRAERVRSIVPKTDEAAAAIAAFWVRRWLTPRVANPEVRDAIREHTLVYPIAHGGRVQLPAVPGEEGPLFAPAELDGRASVDAEIEIPMVVGA